MLYLLSQTVDRAAQRDPDRAAFRVPGRQLTYGELAETSNRLARLLIDQGVRPGDRIGIRMPRCLESALAVHGILKAGAAFVPIDPHAPIGGAAQLIETCGIRHLISHQMPAAGLDELTRRAPKLESVVGCGETLASGVRSLPFTVLDEFPAAAPGVRVIGEDIAYIMFSSGSTGRPKGIVHTHRSGLAYAALSARTYDLRPDDRIGNHSPLHFDMSTLGYLSSPLAGATTVIVPEAYTKLAASLSQLIENEGITIWYSVPLALIQLLLRGVLESRDLACVRWVLFGGEPFPVKHLRSLMQQWPGARFSNVYGPAEVNQCTFYHVPPIDGDDGEDGEDDAPIPIGPVWDNAEGLVVDEKDQVVTRGAAGELLIRSATMMRGYWERPDLNARAFYRRPTPAGDDDVFYRTGDLVRVREDGNLLFLGRKDRQLKVRGYRVELDDIEHALAQQPAVEEAAAFAVRSDAGTHIEAAVVVRAAADIEPDGLREALADVLSWYSVPRRIDVRRELPRTATGKIDRRRLQLDAEDLGAGDTVS